MKSLLLWFSEETRLRDLRYRLSQAEKSWNDFKKSEKYKNMSSDEKQFSQDEYYDEIFPFLDRMEQIKTKRLLSIARRYDIPVPSSHDERYKDYWQEEWAGIKKYLSDAGIQHIRTAIRNEKKERLWWVAPFAALLGVGLALVKFLVW